MKISRVEGGAKGPIGRRGQVTVTLAALAPVLVEVMPIRATPATPRPSLVLPKAIPQRHDRPSVFSQARAAVEPSGMTTGPGNPRPGRDAGHLHEGQMSRPLRGRGDGASPSRRPFPVAPEAPTETARIVPPSGTPLGPLGTGGPSDHAGPSSRTGRAGATQAHIPEFPRAIAHRDEMRGDGTVSWTGPGTTTLG